MKVITLCIGCFFFFLHVQGQSPKLNQEVVSEEGTAKLLGKINKKGLMANSYAAWFDPEYKNYVVDSSRTSALKRYLPGFEIKIFMGTWCGDSKREVPRFYKILEEVGFSKEKLTVVAVDYVKPMYKKSPGGEERGMDIRKVPTFIFFKEGKEVNRIVESPVISLESDVEKIITGENYIPNYSKVRVVPID